jgi:hypothetical protein
MFAGLEVRLDNILTATNGPLNNLHAVESAGPVALLVALEAVELVVCSVAEGLAVEVGEVIPLSESLDIAVNQRRRCLVDVARILVDLRQALDEQATSGVLRLKLVRAPRPGD